MPAALAAVLEGVVENSPSPIWISDENGIMIRMNEACRELLHASDEELVGKYNVFEDRIVERQGAMPLVKSVFEKGETVVYPPVQPAQLRPLQPETAGERVLEVTISPVPDSQGRSSTRCPVSGHHRADGPHAADPAAQQRAAGDSQHDRHGHLLHRNRKSVGQPVVRVDVRL